MKFKPIFAMTWVVAAFAALPSLAGAPDDPGAGGQAVKETVAAAKELGYTWGELVVEYFAGEDINLGEAVSSINEPNPANDNGGGND